MVELPGSDPGSSNAVVLLVKARIAAPTEYLIPTTRTSKAGPT